MNRILIIGPGRVGMALKRTFMHFQQEEPVMAARGYKSGLIDKAEIIFITTPDAEVPKVVKEICESDLRGRSVIHMSGSLVSEVLSPCVTKGARIAGMHPMKAVSVTTKDLSNSYFDLEGDASLCTELSELIDSWNSRALMVSASQKQKLHIASVFVSNYLVALMESALELMGEADTDRDEIRNALIPLMESSIGNLKNSDTSDALTGPVQRGEQMVIAAHMQLLTDKPELRELYRLLALKCLKMTSHPPETEQKIREILK